MTRLVWKHVEYYSSLDEETFFFAIGKLRSVVSIEGSGDELSVILKENVEDNDLRDLIGLSMRFNLDMSQLALLRNDSNSHWFFDNTCAYWHQKVFLLETETGTQTLFPREP